MRRLYYENPYASTCESVVLTVKAADDCTLVTVDASLFYPEGGGQHGDAGFLGPHRVLDTRKDKDGGSVLVLEKGAAINPGETLREEIDWKRRYVHMVYHTAQHLVSGLLYTHFGIGTTSVHLGDDYITIETDRPDVTSAVVRETERLANTAIRENHNVLYHEMSHEEAERLGLRRSIKVDGDVRIVEIEGLDRIACGGLHVKSTSEIGLLLYEKTEVLRGHARLYFRAGEEAVSFARRGLDMFEAVKRTLQTSDEETLRKIESLKETATKEKKRALGLSERVALLSVREKIKNGSAVFSTDLPAASFTKIPEMYTDLGLLVYDGESWLIALKGLFGKIDFDTVKDELFSCAGAKGGGRNGFYRGSYSDRMGMERFARAFSGMLERISDASPDVGR